MTILFELSIQTLVPAAVVRPATFKKDVPLVFIATLLPFPAVKTDGPLAVKVWPVATVAPPLNVDRPVTLRALFMVVFPVAEPILTVVAAPPIFNVVAVVLKR